MRKVTNLCFPEPARVVKLLDIWYLKGGFAMANYLAGQMLIAMPQMDDKRFRNSVILICSHDSDAAMGLIINQPMDGLYLDELAEQIGISAVMFLFSMAGRLNSLAAWCCIRLNMSCPIPSPSMIAWP
jgi:putative AlgH/UPF0301 family transcriptional regulator